MYRSVNFKRDVLWPLAYKAGLDPATNLLVDTAERMTQSVNSWVRRAWEAADWPEWTPVRPFGVVTHQVGWNQFPADYDSAHELPSQVQIGDIVKAYLVDPRTTPLPFDIPFKLNPTGAHIGFDHGATVFLKYRLRAPQFTSVKWSNVVTYGLDDLTYSPVTGQCYRSTTDGNLGNDPSRTGAPPKPPDPTTQQTFLPDNPGLAGQEQRLTVHLLGGVPGPDPNNIPANNSSFIVQVLDEDLVEVGFADHLANGSETLAVIIADLATTLDADLGGGWTVAVDTGELTISVQHASNFSMPRCVWYPPVGYPVTFLPVFQLTAYIPPSGSITGTPKIINVQFPVNAAAKNTLYTFTFLDSSGQIHTASFDTGASDTGYALPQILAGIIYSIQGQTDDDFLTKAQILTDGISSITFSVPDDFSLTLKTEPSPGSGGPVNLPVGSAHWEEIFFPYALLDQVLRGALSDNMRVEGQNDKADSEEAKVITEEQTKETTLMPPQYGHLTDQSKPTSRYQIK